MGKGGKETGEEREGEGEGEGVREGGEKEEGREGGRAGGRESRGCVRERRSDGGSERARGAAPDEQGAFQRCAVEIHFRFHFSPYVIILHVAIHCRFHFSRFVIILHAADARTPRRG